MNLYLIGYRGSGKSTVARLLATQLHRELLDTDQFIEDQAGQSIAEIFRESGEPHFRALEKDLIHSFAATDRRVVSLGGGAVLDPANRQWLNQTGKVVWLQADATTLWQRVAADPSTGQRRPDLTDQGGQAEIECLLLQREPLYAQCSDFSVAVDELTPTQISASIIAWWRSMPGKG